MITVTRCTPPLLATMFASAIVFSAVRSERSRRARRAPKRRRQPPRRPRPIRACGRGREGESKGFWEGTELGGLMTRYYDYYSTKPEGDALYRLFDTKHNQFNLNMAEMWLAKAPTADSRAASSCARPRDRRRR